MSKKFKVKNKYEKNNDVVMTWRMRWLNRSVATINTTLQLLDIDLRNTPHDIHWKVSYMSNDTLKLGFCFN